MTASTSTDSLASDDGILRVKARELVEPASANMAFAADRILVLELLNQSLANKIISVFRYRRHHVIARGMHAMNIAGEFLQHAKEALEHADKIAERIIQLGGGPDFCPDARITLQPIEHKAGLSPIEMITENLAAERTAIECCRDLIQRIDDNDSITGNMLKEILAKEEFQAGSLSHLLSVHLAVK